MKRITPILLMLGACTSVPQYEPQPISREAALGAIEQCLREQPPDVGPIDVQVTSDYMRAVYGTVDQVVGLRRLAVPLTGVEQKTVYYTSVGHIVLERDEGMWLANVHNKANNEVMFCYSDDIETVKRFIDGVMSLR